MAQHQATVQRTGTYYGIMTGIAAIIYILLVKAIGQIENVGLHFLTGIILVIGVCLAIKRYKTAKNGHINYLEGVGVGFMVGFISSGLYAFFQLIFDYVFNLGLSYPYKADEGYGSEGSIWMVHSTWVMMGIVLGPFIAYLAMQFFKRPDHKLSNS